MSLLSTLGGIGKTIGAFVTGGPVAGISTAVQQIGGARSGAQNNPGQQTFTSSLPQLPSLGGTLGNIFSGGFQTGQQIASLVTGQPVGGTAVAPSSGGIPTRFGVLQAGVAPTVKTRSVRKCGRGYALAMDGKCYPRAMLPRWARAWKPEPRPVVSRSDQKAIRRAEAAKKRLVKLTRAAGAHAAMHAPHHERKPARRR